MNSTDSECGKKRHELSSESEQESPKKCYTRNTSQVECVSFQSRKIRRRQACESNDDTSSDCPVSTSPVKSFPSKKKVSQRSRRRKSSTDSGEETTTNNANSSSYRSRRKRKGPTGDGNHLPNPQGVDKVNLGTCSFDMNSCSNSSCISTDEENQGLQPGFVNKLFT